MKKVLALVMMIVLVCSCAMFTSCNNAKYTVGILQLQEHAALDAATQGFKDALVDALGDDVAFDEQNAQGSTDTCATIAGTFVTKNVDLIMANATPALQAVTAATQTIPVLGTSITEYGVALGIENFSGTVGGNISGTSDLAPLDQQAQMVIDLVPTATKVGLLYCSAEANSEYQVKVVKEYLEAKNISCAEYKFSDANDVQAVATKAASECGAIYIPTDNTAASNAVAIWGAISDKKVPVIAGEEGTCKGCGIATLSINYYDLGYKTGEMAAKILKGETTIDTMPIEYTPNDKLSKLYNKEICEELGINTADLEAKGYKAIVTE